MFNWINDNNNKLIIRFTAKLSFIRVNKSQTVYLKKKIELTKSFFLYTIWGMKIKKNLPKADTTIIKMKHFSSMILRKKDDRVQHAVSIAVRK